jgi:hypothetical protein
MLQRAKCLVHDTLVPPQNSAQSDVNVRQRNVAAHGLSPHVLCIWRDRIEQSGSEMERDHCFIPASEFN